MQSCHALDLMHEPSPQFSLQHTTHNTLSDTHSMPRRPLRFYFDLTTIATGVNHTLHASIATTGVQLDKMDLVFVFDNVDTELAPVDAQLWT